MYNTLYDYLKRPALYERTTGKFWTDPHIATQMLEAHLNPNTDAASRKPDFINRCSEWVSSLLPSHASLLDIGCGPGLYTKRFAERGLRVTGLDFSENSITYAREYDPVSRYVLQDYLTMDFDDEFDMITIIYYDFGALIPEERRELLRRVYKALRPGGHFLLDVYTPLRGKGKQGNTSWNVNPNGGFWSARPHICLNAEYFFEHTAEGHRYVVIEENGIQCFNTWDCYFTRQSLLNEVATFGFAECGFYNDVTGQSHSNDSETICAILKK